MKRKTKDLFIVKRLLAMAISKLQMILLKKNGPLAFKMYYKLAAMHFKLHYGFTLRAAVKTLGGSVTSDLSVLYAARRHARMIIKVNNLQDENAATKKYYYEGAINGFISNVSRM